MVGRIEDDKLMRINKVVFIFLSALTLIASANELPHNKTSVQMKGTALSKTPGECSECTGLAHYTPAISDIGLSEKQLKDPLPCMWGDLDGNGFIDIAIWGALTENPGWGAATADCWRALSPLPAHWPLWVQRSWV